MSPPSPVAEALRRTGVAAGLMVGTALGAHAVAGGDLPPASVLVVLVTALVGVGTIVAGGRVGRWACLTLVGVSQSVVHELLVLTSGWSATSGPGALGGCVDLHGHSVLARCTEGGTAGAMAHAAAGGSDSRMLAFHAVATVVTGWLLCVGDRVAAVARAAFRPLWRVRSMPRLLVPGTPTHWVDVNPYVPVASLVCVERRPRRGPPRTGGVAPLLPA
jgi:hypothetical protein